MAIAARIGNALAALLGRATTAQVLDGTITPWSGPYATRTDIQAMIDRSFSVVGIASKFNAQACADVPVRLYAKGKGKMPRARAVWLKSSRPNAGPGVRAAMYAQHAEKFVEVKSHPVLDLLQHPNDYETGIEYVRKHFLFQELCGNSFHVLDVGDRTQEPVSMNQLMPQWVRALPAPKGSGAIVAGWQYGRDYGNQQTFTPDEVVHAKMFSCPSDVVWGVGPLHDVSREFDLVAYSLQYETSLMQNESRPSYVLEAGPTVTADQMKAMLAEFEKRHRGPNKVGRISAMRDAVLKPLGLSAKEMQYREGIAIMEKRILRAYGIPEALLSRDQGTINIGGGGASSAAKSVWLSLTILPRVNAWADTLNTYLLPRFGVKPGAMWFAADNPDGDDSTLEEDRAMKAAAAGLKTLNEARAEIGYDPYPPEWGDVPRVNGKSVVAIDAAPASPFGFASEPRKACGCGKRHTRAADPDNKLDGMAFTEVEKAAKKWVDQTIGIIAAAVKPDASITVAVDPIAASYNEIVGPPIITYWGKGWDSTLPTLAKIKPAAIPAFNVTNVWAVEYAKKTAIELAPSVTQTLVDAGREAALETLNQTIAEGIAGGATGPQLQAAVKAKLGAISEAHAATIANTESAKAYGMGTLQGWKESGIVRSRVWLISSDPCPLCAQAAEDFNREGGVPLDKPFYRAGDVVAGATLTQDVWAPGFIHPNCRCDMSIGEYVR